MPSDSVDAGLDELTSDVLGPSADATDAPSDGGEQDAPTPQEPTQPSEPAPASAQPQAVAPTPTPPETPIEIDGRQFTREQLKAALTTAQQFPHLQKKWADRLEADDAARQQAARTPQSPQRLDPAHVKAQIRASFDGAVKEAVDQGFIEPDFAILYPDLAASMVMNRDALTATIGVLNIQKQKIEQYEQQMGAQQARTEIFNNMVALSTQHAALAPLAEPAKQQQFLDFLVSMNPPMALMGDADFLVSQWVAFNRNTYLAGTDATRARITAEQQQRTLNKRRAAGDAVGNSRPAAGAATPASPLDEMVDDFFAPR
jgi:hypothetical protein